MRRTVAACACALAIAGAAAAARAQKAHKVSVGSTPPGAEIRIDDRAAPPIGVTPWTGSLPAGNHMVILSAAGHHELVEELVVAGGKKLQKFSFTLQAITYGNVQVVLGPAESDGAEVLVDGESKGQVPTVLHLEVGPHQIEIVKRGFKRFEKWIEVAEGDQEVEAALVPVGEVAVTKPSRPGPPRTDPLVVAGAGLEVAWRRFRYDEPMTASARPFDATAVPLVRVDLELRPLAGRGGALAHLGAAFEGAFGFPPAADTSSGGAVETSWTELAGALRYRHRLGSGAELGGDAALARTAFGFGAGGGGLGDEAPVADYVHLRLGLAGGIRRGKLGAGAGAAYMVPLSLGPLADRFRAASAGGLAAAASVCYRVMPRVDASIAFSFRRWAWNFTAEPGDIVVASGGSDRYVGLTIGAAYLY